MTQPFSRYIVEITAFAMSTKAKAAYCFVLDGDRGTGGCPFVVGLVPPDEYRARCEELIKMAAERGYAASGHRSAGAEVIALILGLVVSVVCLALWWLSGLERRGPE
jgi:hypothetical protein